MSEKRLSFAFQWETAGNDSPELLQTMARWSLAVNGYSLTRNEDIWSRTVKNDVLVSLYPLANWFASNWWRLQHEPHPGNGVRPSASWRMAHELVAANQGFVWPTVMFASDGEGIQVWSSVSAQDEAQSVRYLNGSRFPSYVPLADFSKEVSGFIVAVLDRLRDSGGLETELAELWGIICEEKSNPELARLRAFEAVMGYDPEECPEALLQAMLSLSTTVGERSLSELMSALATGQEFQAVQQEQIQTLSRLGGLEGKPDMPAAVEDASGHSCEPWRLAVEDAKRLRGHLGQGLDPIDDDTLLDALGVSRTAASAYFPENTSRVSVAIPMPQQRIRFIPRKKHPVARRFEYARLLADSLFQQQQDDGWLVSSDLATYRQKYQRAFAAELLCPVEGVMQRMQEDYSESAIEDAAEHFQVSTTTVTSLLANNHLIDNDAQPSGSGSWPYLPVIAAR